jgi:hypothetical protein
MYYVALVVLSPRWQLSQITKPTQENEHRFESNTSSKRTNYDSNLIQSNSISTWSNTNSASVGDRLGNINIYSHGFTSTEMSHIATHTRKLIKSTHVFKSEWKWLETFSAGWPAANWRSVGRKLDPHVTQSQYWYMCPHSAALH